MQSCDHCHVVAANIQQGLFSPCSDHQSGRVVFVAHYAEKSVVEAEPHLQSSLTEARSARYLAHTSDSGTCTIRYEPTSLKAWSSRRPSLTTRTEIGRAASQE